MAGFWQLVGVTVLAIVSFAFAMVLFAVLLGASFGAWFRAQRKRQRCPQCRFRGHVFDVIIHQEKEHQR